MAGNVIKKGRQRNGGPAGGRTLTRAGCGWLLPLASCLGVTHGLLGSIFRFDLPGDELPRALQTFNRQSHMEVIYVNVPEPHSIHTQPVSGSLKPAEALARMLQGTPLTFIFDTDHSAIIRYTKPTPLVAAHPPEPDGSGSALPETRHGPAGPPDASKLEVVQVISTRLHGLQDTGAPIVNLTSREISLAAYPTIQDAFAQLPISSLNTPRQDLGLSYNYSWGAGLNLRGLGVGATLVLVDGQRQALSGYNGDFVDVSNIPAAFVERIDILPDGASSLWGSDAVAGVVNIILRKDPGAGQTMVHAGTAMDGRREVTASQLSGLRWSQGWLALGYQYLDETPLMAASRTYAADADKTSLGGGNYRSVYSNPGNVLDPATSQPIGDPNLQNPFSQYQLFPDIRQHNLYLSASQTLGDSVDLFGSVRGTRRDALTQQEPYQQVLVVPSTNPYYTSVGGSSAPMLVAYSFLSATGPSRSVAHTDSYSGTLGARVGLWSGWQATLSGSLGREQLAISYNQPDQAALAKALASSDPAVAFNPFGTSPAATVAAVERTTLGHAGSDLGEGSVTADGPIVRLPAGSVRLAVGLERRQEGLRHDVPDPANPLESTISQHYSRNIDAAFTELSVPLLAGRADGDGSQPPRLELRLAGRYERYSDFGDTFNPTTRLAWQAFSGLKLRASWGRSFRAPTLNDLYDSAQNGAGFTVLRDPASASGQALVLVRQGDNPSLKQEVASTWTAGLDLAPMGAAGPQLSLTYYNIHYQNEIGQPAAADPYSILFNASAWASVITRDPTPAQIAAVCNVPGLFQGSAAACLASSPAAIIDLRLANLSSTAVSGLDLEAHQQLDTSFGRLNGSLTGAYLFHYYQAATDTSVPQDVLNTVGNPLALRLRASLEWEEGTAEQGLGATLAFSYTSGYRDPASTLVPRVDSFLSTDLQLRYRWSGYELNLNTVNLFNRSPPFVDSQYGYDRFNMQPLGRVVGLSVTRSW